MRRNQTPKNGHLLRSTSAAANALYTKISLDVRVREIARMRVAQINRCHI